MSLRQQAARGGYWTAGSGVIVTGLQFVQLVVLARLLVPEDFGLMAMILVIVGLAQAFADAGISNAIVHRQEATGEELSSLYWLNLAVGVGLFVVLLAATPAAAVFFSEPRLRNILPVAAVLFLIQPFGQVYQALLQKNLEFRGLAVSESVAALAGAATAVSLAVAGYGVYSLVVGQIANVTARACMVIRYGIAKWRPARRFRLRDLGGYLQFGLFQMGERIVNFVNERLDQVVIGSLLGAQTLGYYHLAFNLVILPTTRINPIVTRVVFPIFAKVQNDIERLTQGLMEVRRLLAAVNFPLLVGLAAVAPVFVPAVLGPDWAPAAVLIQLLAGVGLLRSTGNAVGAMVLAKGRADLGFYWNLLVVVTQIPIVVFGAYVGGAVGVAAMLLVGQAVYFLVGYRFLVRPVLGPCFKRYLSALAPAAITASAMGVVVAVAPAGIKVDGFVLLAMQVAGGGIIYVGLNWFLFRDESLWLLATLTGRRV